jgi:pimeloyl-ACP methyl ester carboxylesterase
MNHPAFVLAILACLVGCSHQPAAPDLGAIYNAAARQSHVDRNPIIVIPGILGSKLVDTEDGRIVWGRFGSGAIDHGSVEGMRSLALPVSTSGWPRDGVKPAGVLSELEIEWGLNFRFKAYSQMLAAFGAGGYLDPALTASDSIDYGREHFTCFQFAYDWRRSCAENAALLGEFIEEKRRYVAKERKRLYGSSAPVKFDINAHSMGGLIARYYLMYGSRPLDPKGDMAVTWAGARHVDKLIVVGTPNGGSVYPFHDIHEGFRLSPLVPRFKAAAIGTMPSVYELLPPESDGALIDEHSRPIPYYDAAEWERRGWGLLDPAHADDLADLMPETPEAAERHRRARNQVSKLLQNARAFHRAINRESRLPGGLELYSFAGDAVKTGSRVQVSASGEMAIIDWIPGDGTVTRASVLRDLRKPDQAASRLMSPIPWTSSYFVFTDHVSMTSDPAFVDNVLHLLLERP